MVDLTQTWDIVKSSMISSLYRRGWRVRTGGSSETAPDLRLLFNENEKILYWILSLLNIAEIYP